MQDLKCGSVSGVEVRAQSEIPKKGCGAGRQVAKYIRLIKHLQTSTQINFIKVPLCFFADPITY
jgi:hypothetical protein